MFSETSQRLKFRERPDGSQPYFTLLWDEKYYPVAFPYDQFEMFMQWKRDYVDNVPELDHVMFNLFPI